MTGGTSPIGYLKAWHTNLYLSADADKVREALAEGEAALPHHSRKQTYNISSHLSKPQNLSSRLRRCR